MSDFIKMNINPDSIGYFCAFISLLISLFYFTFGKRAIQCIISHFIRSKVNQRLDENFLQVMKNHDMKIAVFYGSETGTARKYAINLGNSFNKIGLANVVVDMKYCSMQSLLGLSTIENNVGIFILTTYGEGEPTENARLFVEELENFQTTLNNFNYAVFGLGNSAYSYYNVCAKLVDTNLRKFGANPLLSKCLGDELDNLEKTFLDWELLLCSKLINLHYEQSNLNSDVKLDLRSYKNIYQLHYHNSYLYLPKFIRIKLFGAWNQANSIQSNINSKPPYNSSNPFWAQVLVNKELYAKGPRSCRHIELDITESNLGYKTGDHVAVKVPNPFGVVELLGKFLNLNLDHLISMDPVNSLSGLESPFPCPCTFRSALTYYLDLTGPPSRNLLRICSNYATNPRESNFISKLGANNSDGENLYSEWIVQEHRGIVDIMKELNSFRPPIDLLLELLNPLKPRYYSISSSSLMFPNQIHITVAVVNYDTKTGRNVKGLASNWLSSTGPSGRIHNDPEIKRTKCDLNSVTKIPIFIHPSRFHLPRSHTLPIIMISAGTGFAPFRAFIQERLSIATKKTTKVGQMYLFFGCRHHDEDFIYADELNQACQNKLLELRTAFSRDSPSDQKIYVQHCLKEMGSKIWELLDHSHAYLYICGNATGMARDVSTCLTEVICKYGKLNMKNTENYILNLRQQGRYNLDTWG